MRRAAVHKYSFIVFIDFTPNLHDSGREEMQLSELTPHIFYCSAQICMHSKGLPL